MLFRCSECGGIHIYDLGVKVHKNEIEAISVNEHDCKLNKETLPYILGGYYCTDCQSFCSVIEESEPDDNKPISDKQKDFLNTLLNKLDQKRYWPDTKIEKLTKKDASKLIFKLKKKYDDRPKRTIAPATEKQKHYIRALIEKSEHKYRYATTDIDALNVLSAGRIISELTKE